MPTEAQRRLANKMVGTQAMGEGIPFNALKAGEYGEAASTPAEGQVSPPHDPHDTASTVMEDVASDKVGSGVPPSGFNPGNGPLDRVRVDSGGQGLTTNQGVPIADNQHSLKAGVRGPTLLEDFILREKITHFDHERIPERVVHARGSAAHGFFECTAAIPELTKAAPFQKVGKRTPVFTRFSTVAGERGSADLARDVRGFAVKFYTEQGNWDLVGNNIPVFFIQDGMKFPDLVHAVKPEPHHGMPQAASAHDTFWDFAGLMPEITHMLMWVMSDRAIPRSYRTMQGFGVHTFRLVNEAGESVFVKFHWNPVAGTHSLVWDEAVKVNGADPDYHRRDLWESIEAGNFPEYELQLQVFTEAQAEGFTFDVLDPTKIVPEELVPLRTVGRMVLNRNPDNFFAETEQVAFCTQHVIPGIDFSNDPLLQARNFSYHDTQLLRLGGPNFHEIPINAPVAQVHNNQRDGFHRQAIPRGRVAYEPNSLGGGCPFQAGSMKGYTSFPAPVFEDKVRGKPEKFGDHFSQARLFFRSQTPVEQNHIAAAFRFELTKVQTQAVRERIVSMLRNVDDGLAGAVANGLGIPLPDPQPTAIDVIPDSEVESSPALSLFARPGNVGIKGRKIALMVVDGADSATLRAAHAALAKAEAAPRFIGIRLGSVKVEGGDPIHSEITLETAPSVLWDAVVVPGGEEALELLQKSGQAQEFLKDQYRHCKTILSLGESKALLEAVGISPTLPDGSPDPGVISDSVADFIEAVAKHRHFERELDPPSV
jgi:catalase